MSRIGNQPIAVPNEVSLEISENIVSVKGPKGNLNLEMDSKIGIKKEDNSITLSRKSEQKEYKSKHGLYRALINNMIIGVTTGYKKSLELVGVGYKANAQKNILEMSLGFSHSIMFVMPSEIKLTTETVKGKNPLIHIEGNDKQLVGQIAARIRKLRPPEPYKGKGIKFVGEILRRKAGKTASK